MHSHTLVPGTQRGTVGRTWGKCNLNAAEYSVAKAARDTLVDFIYRWCSRREASVFWDLEATWSEFKTPLRTWPTEERCHTYLQIVAEDMGFDRNATARAVVNKLIYDVTGISDPWQRLDLEGVAVCAPVG